jgi:hypothetical protein
MLLRVQLQGQSFFIVWSILFEIEEQDHMEPRRGGAKRFKELSCYEDLFQLREIRRTCMVFYDCLCLAPFY